MLAVPTHLYGSETWVKENTVVSDQAAKIIFKKWQWMCQIRQLKTEVYGNELRICLVCLNRRIDDWRGKWLTHLNIKDSGGIPELTLLQTKGIVV
jgi:hypothetical protein